MQNKLGLSVDPKITILDDSARISETDLLVAMDPGIGTAGLVSMLQNSLLFTTDAAAN